MPQRRSWKSGEIAFLEQKAGEIPLSHLARFLGRSERSVKMMAHRLGLSLRCVRWDLVWCSHCSSWRSAVDIQTGRCRVCREQVKLADAKERCERELRRLSDEQRAGFEDGRRWRGSKKPLPPKPRMPASSPASAYERKRARRHYLLAMEEWEYQRARRPYNAEKKRLQRIREILGTNPRKKFSRS